MGKAVKTVLKIAAVAAIGFFAPPLAGAALNSFGLSAALGATGTALAKTALSSAIGAGLGELSGVGWKAGLMAGGLAGASSSNLFGGGVPAAGATGTTGAAGTPVAGVGGTPVAGVTGAPAAGVTSAPAAGVGVYGPEFSLGAPTAGAAGTAAAPQTLGQTLSSAAAKPTSVLTKGMSNITQGVSQGANAVGLGGTVGKVAPQLVAAGLTTTPGSGITEAQQAELVRAQNMNAALTQQRLDQANKLIGEAAYYDPEYMARQAAETAQIRGGLQETEGTRGLTGERLAAERRRYRLNTSRAAGSAYQQGYGTGVGARTQTRQAGIQAIPTSYPTTGGESTTALTNRFTAEEERRRKEDDLAKLFGQALNRPPTATTPA